MLGLICITGVKHLRALLAKKFQRRPQFFLHGFRQAHSDLQLCFVQLKTLAPSARHSTCKYTVTLKPGLGVTQDHRKLYHSIRHARLPINVTFHSNHRPISYRFRDKRRFPLKNDNFPQLRVYIYSPTEGVPLELGIGAGVRRN